MGALFDEVEAADGTTVRRYRDFAEAAPAAPSEIPVVTPALRPGWAQRPARSEATAPSPGRPASPVRIVLQRGRGAFGRVLGPDQRPVAGAPVTLRTALPTDQRLRIRAAFEPEQFGGERFGLGGE